jgi:hypothetical protein
VTNKNVQKLELPRAYFNVVFSRVEKARNINPYLVPATRKSFDWAQITKMPSRNGRENEAFCSTVL